MSDYLDFTTARKQSRSSLSSSWLDGGTVKLYTAARPATPDTAIVDQTLLATFVLEDPAGSSTDGVLTGTLPEPAMVVADRVPAWARAFDDQGQAIWDTDVGATGSGNAIELDTLTLVAGSLVAMTTFVVTEG